jgi:hypothetical protein
VYYYEFWSRINSIFMAVAFDTGEKIFGMIYIRDIRATREKMPDDLRRSMR